MALGHWARESLPQDARIGVNDTGAIAYFGNAGCQYDSEAAVPLPRGIRRRVAEISRLERDLERLHTEHARQYREWRATEDDLLKKVAAQDYELRQWREEAL